MFFLGMFWKRTTGTAIIVKSISGFCIVYFYLMVHQCYLVMKLCYTRHIQMEGGFEIPFHICNGIIL
jgi:SSS family solute:Na+ symporter